MLTTKRTNIRPLRNEDFQSLLKMYLEPDSNKFVAPFRDKSKEFYEAFLEKKIEQNNKEIGFWVVLEKDSKNILGTVNLNFFEAFSIYHVGCHLVKSSWNQGFATELLEAVIKYGIKERKLDAIHGIVEKENLISKKLMKKLGFHRDRIEILEDVELEVFKLNTIK